MADKIGRRCEFSGHFGTVRYFGEVKATVGSWYGIEWDEERGKHNGSYDGKIYFKCRDGYGSFVRPQKVNFGISISEAIERRYGSHSDDVDENNLYVVGEKNQRTMVEVVGFDQIKNTFMQLKSLSKISLVGMNVNGHDDDNNVQSVGQIVPSISHLDLSRNLLASWSDILVIVRQLKNLQVLNISDNRLSDLNDVTSPFLLLESLKTIFVNRTNMDWNQVINLLHCLPNLIELHACFNGIQRLPNRCGEDGLHSIQLLNLEGNELNDWNEIMKFSTLKSLRTLILNNNKLSKISFSKADFGIGFQTLEAISLSYNKISEWHSISQLAHLESLTAIKFKANPLCDDLPSLDIREELIARLKKVKVINGSQVNARERKDAELLYMKKYSSSWREHGGTQDQLTMKLSSEFQEAHPRFIELLQSYGAPVENVKVGKTLKDNLISLRFQRPDLVESKTITKRVPRTMTIMQLKNLLQRMFKVKAIEQRLSYHDAKIKSEVQLDDNLRELEFYSVSENDIILIRL